MEDWDKVKDVVVEQLRHLDAMELARFCASSNVTVPDAKKGNRGAIYSLVMHHIDSETVEDSEDHGLELFTNMDTLLKETLASRNPAPNEVETKEVTTTGEGNTGKELKNNGKTLMRDLKKEETGTSSSMSSGGSYSGMAVLINLRLNEKTMVVQESTTNGREYDFTCVVCANSRFTAVSWQVETARLHTRTSCSRLKMRVISSRIVR